MPTLFVLGGANGAGKTTWHSAGIVNNFINEGLPFINVDNIVLLELGGFTSENIARAEQLSRERMAILISERKDFMIESNLSKSSDYEWIALMCKNGYDTSLFFLGTDDVEINKSRVTCPPASFNIIKVANIVFAADLFDGANFSNSFSIFNGGKVFFKIGTTCRFMLLEVDVRKKHHWFSII